MRRLLVIADEHDAWLDRKAAKRLKGWPQPRETDRESIARMEAEKRLQAQREQRERPPRSPRLTEVV